MSGMGIVSNAASVARVRIASFTSHPYAQYTTKKDR